MAEYAEAEELIAADECDETVVCVRATLLPVNSI